MKKLILSAELKALLGEVGRQGGLARAEKLTPKRRKEIAKKAAQARWEKYYRENPK